MRIKVITIFAYCCVILILLFLYQCLINIIYIIMNIDISETTNEDNESGQNVVYDYDNVINPKYILIWTSPMKSPFVYMGEGRQVFLDRNCPFTNCFITSDRSYLDDYTKFDMIAFGGPEVRSMHKQFYLYPLPTRRSASQKYVYVASESADNYPMCTNAFDSYFNWTWTYKLDSNITLGYIAIRDSQNKFIGPKTNMHWMKLEDMDALSENLKKSLKSKTKAAAWFVSNCFSRSKREVFVKELKIELAKYNLAVDIYGECRFMKPLKCSRDNEDECNEMIETDYYFYLSFENSFAEDYVTEKILYPLKHWAVPIVYGGANYTRFMPDGIYLNARELGPAKLAKKMHELIKDPEAYADFFRWRNHYSYHYRYENIETDNYCELCSILNNENLVRTNSIQKNFRKWWDPPNRC